jgi:hypothetical protein
MKHQIRMFYSGDWDKWWGWSEWSDCSPEEASKAAALNRPDIQVRTVA